jgi:tetratricopeptide (TPR) repeat protein
MAGRDNKREARARFLLGNLLAEIYSNECAAELLSDAARLDPGLVAAHVDLGFVLARDEDYKGMIEAFREAIRIDPSAARAAAVWEPDEMEPLWRILRPEAPRAGRPRPSPSPAMPAVFREAGALVSSAGEHLTAGRDEAAAAALMQAIRLDPTYSFPIAMLALITLLAQSKTSAAGAMVDAEGVLREVEPGLAELLFDS